MLGTLDAAQTEDLLESEVTGRLGCHAEGRTYVVPITYVYKGGCVYGHSAEGLKVRMMRKNPRVCFQTDRIEDMANWRSVIAWGSFEELSGRAVVDAMDLLIRRLSGMIVSATSHPSLLVRGLPPEPPSSDGSAVVLYRIRLDEKTGRFERP